MLRYALLLVVVMACAIPLVLRAQNTPPANPAQEPTATEPKPAETPAPPTQTSAPAASAPLEAANPFALPEGTEPTSVRLFLNRIARSAPQVRTPEGLLEHFGKAGVAVDELLSRDLETDLYLNALELRFSILGLMEELGDETASKTQETLMAKLKADERPEVKELVDQLELESQISSLGDKTGEERMAIVQRVASMIQEAGKDDLEALQASLNSAMTTTNVLESIEDYPRAAAATKLFAKYLSARQDPRLERLVASLESNVHRLELPGNAMEVKGTTIDGAPFDVKSLEGKVVVVDFWATWCGPCVAEMPNLKRMYAAYHDKGLEIVGISLDESRDDLEGFLEQNEIPWITLFDESEGNAGPNNPNAVRYGINGIPAVFLIDQTGKVVSLSARGPKLPQLLEKLLGPVELPAEPAAELTPPKAE